MFGSLSIISGTDHYDSCQCGNPLYWANTQCMACGAAIGFDPISQRVASFTTDVATGHWHASIPEIAGSAFRPCSQRDSECNCNWMIDAALIGGNCVSCQLTLTIPQLDVTGNVKLWSKAETAKRRVLTQLLRLGLPITNMGSDPTGLGFRFMASLPGEITLTSHEGGVITINISEADDSEREAMRERMGEKYRSLVGHIRHELGHFYWDLLSRDSAWLEDFRGCFGDERQSYDAALRIHHENGPPVSWPENHISAYASSHPWEDWAETFGYFLHLEEGLSLARHFGLEPNALRLSVTEFNVSALPADINNSGNVEFVADLNRWIRLSLLINALAEGLGQPHPSPFILNVTTVAKLWLVHSSLQKIRQGT